VCYSCVDVDTLSTAVASLCRQWHSYFVTMPLKELDADGMSAVGRDVLSLPQKSKNEEDSIFKSHFGAGAHIIALLWNMLLPRIDLNGALPKHLLWSLVFLKVYSTTAVHRGIVGWPDANTYRKWCWYFLEKIASLRDEVIKLEDRFVGWDGVASCLMSIDGVDCMVNEPWPFDKKWFSEKFNGPGVKYECRFAFR